MQGRKQKCKIDAKLRATGQARGGRKFIHNNESSSLSLSQLARVGKEKRHSRALGSLSLGRLQAMTPPPSLSNLEIPRVEFPSSPSANALNMCAVSVSKKP